VRPRESRSASDERGAIYTPPWVARWIVERTLAPLTAGLDPPALLALRVLDPACGDGALLCCAHDHLRDALLAWCLDHPGDPRTRRLLDVDRATLVASVRRSLVTCCLHGVEIDGEAVDAARSALARRCGDVVEPRELASIREGDALAESHEAYDAVVGNPPYLELKRYSGWLPAARTTRRGRPDLSVLILERAAERLRPGGRLGFIIQSRFFRSDSGAPTRRWLAESHLLDEIHDLGALEVFPGRTTYTAIVILQRPAEPAAPAAPRDAARYLGYSTLAAARRRRPRITRRLDPAELSDPIWTFDQPELRALHRELAARHGTIAGHDALAVVVGLQTLYGRVYQLRPLRVTSRTVEGVNGLGEPALLERGALRPLCRNRGFYPLRAANDDAWVIFPYAVAGGEARELRWRELRASFPRTARYLAERRALVKRAVATWPDDDRWHLYRYPKNLVAQARAKLLFPSTIVDTVAAVDPRGEVYTDNVRVNAFCCDRADVDLRALAALFSSSLFSALATLHAGLSEGGWRQLNRQFVALVPLPLDRVAGPAGRELAELAAEVEARQAALASSTTAARLAALRERWRAIDAAVVDLYELTGPERRLAARWPRRVDRVELLLRCLRS
jgi:hypothetical protein